MWRKKSFSPFSGSFLSLCAGLNVLDLSKQKQGHLPISLSTIADEKVFEVTFHWSSAVLATFHWSSVVLATFHWSSAVLATFHWSSAVLATFHWSSAVLAAVFTAAYG